jgi:hypothetical protein
MHGHLSNMQALELFCTSGTHMSHLLLSHLSRDNNNPDLVLELFKSKSQGTEIIVASREMESKIYHINAQPVVQSVKAAATKFGQYSLFS